MGYKTGNPPEEFNLYSTTLCSTHIILVTPQIKFYQISKAYRKAVKKITSVKLNILNLKWEVLYVGKTLFHAYSASHGLGK